MSFSSQHHSFDIALAAKYGLQEAILLHHFQHWIRINTRARRNLKEFPDDMGNKCRKYFTYQSRAEIALHFPYWNYDQIRYLCEQLVESGVLIAKNFNKNPIDKTLWYAFANESEFGLTETQVAEYYRNSNNVYERENSPSKGKSAQPIPDPKSSDTLKEEPPPSPKGGKEDWWGRYFKKTSSREIFEKAWSEYQKSPKGSVKNIKGWLQAVICRINSENLEETARLDRIKRHKTEAQDYEKIARSKKLNTICASPNHVEFISGSRCSLVEYDLPDEEWFDKTSLNFQVYMKRPGEK